MGAWGVLAFDNDDACDWAHDLESVDDFSLIESAFEDVESEDEYLEADEASIALAACEVLARANGGGESRIPTLKLSTTGSTSTSGSHRRR